MDKSPCRLNRSQVTGSDDNRSLMPGQKVKYPAFKQSLLSAHDVCPAGLDMRLHFE